MYLILLCGVALGILGTYLYTHIKNSLDNIDSSFKFAFAKVDIDDTAPHEIPFEVFPKSTGWANVLLIKGLSSDLELTMGFVLPFSAKLAKVIIVDGEKAKLAANSKLEEGELYKVWLRGKNEKGVTLLEIYDDNGKSINTALVDMGFVTKG